MQNNLDQIIKRISIENKKIFIFVIKQTVNCNKDNNYKVLMRNKPKEIIINKLLEIMRDNNKFNNRGNIKGFNKLKNRDKIILVIIPININANL